MKKAEKEKLKKEGWVVGGVKEFLGLSEEEMKLIEIRISLGKILKDQRVKNGYSQIQLAQRIGTNQSRIAKMENGNNSVTIDSLLKSLFYLKVPKKKICSTFQKV